MDTKDITQAISDLQASYLEYMARLKDVLDFGETNVQPLIESLSNRHANPVAKALGLMMYAPSGEIAIPHLLRWLVTQSPLYPDVLEALVRAGDKAAPSTLLAIVEYASKCDDGAVRNLFDLACRFSDKVKPNVVGVAIELFHHPDAHIRETAADAIWRIGLPYGRPASVELTTLASSDSVERVRVSAQEALERLGH